MFNVALVGEAELATALEQVPGSVVEALSKAVTELAIGLREHVIQDKLNGQVLNRVSGNLIASIKQDSPIVDGEKVSGEVFSDSTVKYAVIHEYGLTVSRVSSRGKSFTVTYPERSFMRSSLADQRDMIVERLQAAVVQGIRSPLGAEP